MKLECDDFKGVYVWVSDDETPRDVSPHFDYEEDAVAWAKHHGYKNEIQCLSDSSPNASTL